MIEEWKDIQGYEGVYQVSDLGRIKSLPRNGTVKTERILKNFEASGYLQVALQYHGVVKWEKVHRLVAKAFIPNTDNKREVNHIDGNKKNNSVNNLEWVTTSENILHSYHVLKNHIRKVKQYTKSMELIKEWECIREASKELRICENNISECCRKRRKTAGGYVWEYSEATI